MNAKRFFVKEGRLRPTWRAICYVVAMVAGLFGIQIPLAILLLLAIALGVLDPSSLTHLESSLPFLVLNTVISLAVILPLTYLFRRFLDGQSVGSLGLVTSRGWVRQILAGLLLGTVLMALIFLAEWGLGWLTVEGFSWQVQSFVSLLAGLLAYLLISVAVALYEELAFRGYVLQNLRADWGPIAALLASSLLFGIFHGLNPNVTWLALLNIFLAGAVLAACYLVTRSLWLPMAFHFSWNFVQGPILSFPLSGLHTTGLLVTTIEGNTLLTGGAFGPEGGLLSTAVLCLALLLLWGWHRRARPRRDAEVTVFGRGLSQAASTLVRSAASPQSQSRCDCPHGSRLGCLLTEKDGRCIIEASLKLHGKSDCPTGTNLAEARGKSTLGHAMLNLLSLRTQLHGPFSARRMMKGGD
jgi:membrane protease YdiL (CAAX protease family)